MSTTTVVLASHSARLTDPEIEMARVAAALRRYEPVVLLGQEGPLLDVLAREGVRTEIVSMSRAPRDLAGLTRRLTALSPSLVHVNSFRAGLIVGSTARRARIPVVWHLHDRPGRAARAAMRALAAVAITDSPSTRASVPSRVPSCIVREARAAPIERVYDCVVSGRPGRARHVVVNGRFRIRPTSGVERFAESVTARLTVPARVPTPPRVLARGALGHLWEQVVLPLHVSRVSTLWSPCNFGPAAVRRQIVTVHDLAPCDHPEWFSRSYRAWFNLLVPYLTRRARVVTTVSAFTRDRLAERFGLDPASVRLLPNGCDLRLAGPPSSCAQPRSSGAYVLAVGPADPRKNLEGVRRGVAGARLRHPSLGLQVAGDVSSRVFAREATPVSALDSFVGHVSDEELASLYAGARCLVYPSFYEGFGLPPLEAMALGTRVVASKLPPIEEICGPAAVYVDPADPSDIARGIEQVLHESDDERATAIAQGQTRAALYTWDRAVEIFEEIVLAP
jgi:glycosyltransferase involved in cell wall biosynthesis